MQSPYVSSSEFLTFAFDTQQSLINNPLLMILAIKSFPHWIRSTLTVGTKMYKGINASLIHMHTTSKQVQLESPGAAAQSLLN